MNWPTTYPRNGLLAARVALLAGDSWRKDFSRAVYRANFVEDREISDAALIGDILNSMGCDARTILEEALSAANKAALAAVVDEAIANSIFGAPSFIVGDELFWGNDRLEQAIQWASKP